MTKEEVISTLQHISKETGAPYLTKKDLRKTPGLEYNIYMHFENLAQALREAGLESSALAKKMATTDEELLMYLFDLGRRKNKTPSTLDVNRDRKYNYSIFLRRFGSIKDAYKLAKQKFEPENIPPKTDIDSKDNDNIKVNKADIDEKISTQPIKEFEYKGNFYGVAAENLVVSELLYRGYEAYLINVDLGLDVMAQKDGKTYYFQVKNVSFDKSNTRAVPITKTSYLRNKSNNVYYFFIMQRDLVRDYIIIPQLKLLEFEGKGLINTEEEGKLNLTFTKEKSDYLIKFSSEAENLDAYTNRKAWDYLK